MIPGGVNPLLMSGGGYQVQRSLRFRNAASAYLSRTATAGNTKRFTLAFWMKRGALVDRDIISSKLTGGGYPAFSLGFDGDRLRAWDYSGSVFTLNLYTTALFRDPTAWMLVTLAVDTTQATASNRVRLYVNDKEITSFSTATYPALNADLNWNVAGNTNTIGGQSAGGYGYFDGYLADVMHVNDQQLAPFSFAQYDANGQLQAKGFAGSFGSNGWWLSFSNPASLTTLAADSSGNGNNWTATNVSLTAGATYDSMLDVPLGAGGSERGNYATLNPLRTYALAPSDGNLRVVGPGGARSVFSTQAIQGKMYAEVTLTAIISGNNAFGVANGAAVADSFYLTGQWVVRAYEGNFYASGVGNNPLGPFGAISAGSVGRIAFDSATGKLWLGAGASWFNSGDPAAGTGEVATLNTSEAYFFSGAVFNDTQDWNFGQRPFTYTPPAGFKPLHTGNLPEPVITQPIKHFDVKTHTGNNTSLSITGVAFKPDLAWVKSRSNAYSHILMDAVRGAGKQLSSDTTSAEAGNAGDLITSFNADGITVNTNFAGGFNASTNGLGSSFVDWLWKAGGAPITNNNGSISAQVSANLVAGFSIAAYTGSGANATVGHGLGVAPKMVIVKKRTGTVTNWSVYHAGLSSAANWVQLNTTNAQSAAATVWNSTAPSSSVFSIGTAAETNNNTDTYVAYSFAEIAGFSKFGGYTGNGSADGPFVHCGFRPRFVMAKLTSSAGGNWVILDSARDTVNVGGRELLPNSSGAEAGPGSSDLYVDFTSNGFKIRGTRGDLNNNGATYIFAAFAEAPFKSALAR